MNGKLNITESERRKIKQMYGLVEKQDFVFDFVLTENNKYLIMMDEVFISGNNGKSIGTIWENTHIFNEIIKESLTKLGNTITESVHNEIENILENTKWTKDIVSAWVNENKILTEEENEGLWSKLKTGAKNIASDIGGNIMKGMEWVFKNGVLPFLRWVRRGLYTGLGVVIDVVVSILAVKTNAIVWAVIVLLDIYEIATGDFDPKDPERKESPWWGLIGDSLGLIFTGAVGLAFRKSIPRITKVGVKKGAPTMVKMLQGLSNKLPFLKSTLKNAANTLSKKFKGDTVISVILRSIDKVLTNLQIFLGKLFSKQGAKATAMGLGVGYVHNKLSSDKDTQNNSVDVESGINADIMADAESLGIFTNET
jgi:hypothetical protein